jgi:tRNA G18 (ribose-2'-O)-methylase SpoU
VIAIDDPGDERIADYVGLRDAQLRQRVEAERGVFIAEGVLVIRALLASSYRVRSVLVTPKRLHDLGGDLDGLDAPVYVARLDVLRAVAGFDLHRGAVAAADRPAASPDVDALVRDARRIAVLEGINDAENMGALFRNAAALGVDAVLVGPGCCDPLYRRTVRVSMGHVLSTPFATGVPVPGVFDPLRAHGFRVLALTPEPNAEAIDATDRPDKAALVLGAEGSGLSDRALDAADARVRIPMRPGVDSLNVATAAAIAFYELRATPLRSRPGR